MALLSSPKAEKQILCEDDNQKSKNVHLSFFLSFPMGICFLLLALTGCRSKYIEADIRNAGPVAVTLVELDYPSASFGVETLAAGATYHYRFKILGSGPTKILWTDATHKDHSVAGPPLEEGQEGTLAVTISGDAATWSKQLHP